MYLYFFPKLKKNTTLPYKHLVAICLICKELLSIHHLQITKSCTDPLFTVCQAKYQVIYSYYFTKYVGAFCKGEMLIVLSFSCSLGLRNLLLGRLVAFLIGMFGKRNCGSPPSTSRISCVQKVHICLSLTGSTCFYGERPVVAPHF